VRGIPCWRRGKVGGGGSRRDKVLWTDHNPHSPSPWDTQREDVEGSGMKE